MTAVTTPQPISRSDWRVLAAILVVALGLRLYKLDAGLWYDEVDTLVSHTRPPFSHLLTHLPSFNHHVFFSLQAKASILLFGETPFALRLPAALLGVGSVAALWFVAREIGTIYTAHASALLMAVAYHHVWFSQNGRGYTGLLFWGLLALLSYLRACRAASKAESQRSAIGIAVASALMLYTHLSGGFLLAALGLAHLGSMARAWRGRTADPERLRRLLWPVLGLAGGAALAFLLFVPIIPQVLKTLSATAGSTKGAGAQAQAISHWNSPLWMLKEVLSTFSGLGPFVALAASGVMLVLGAGALALWRRGHGALAATFLIHVPLTILILKLISMRVWPRYFFQDIGFICLFLIEGATALAALGDRLITRFFGRSLGATRLGIAASALGVLGAAAMVPKNYRWPKQDLAGARDLVEARRTKGSAVVTLGLVSEPFSLYYAPSWRPVGSLDELLAVERQNSDVWLVYSFPDVTKKRFPSVMTRLAYSFDKQELLRGTLGDGDVLVYRSRYASSEIRVTDLGGGISLFLTQGKIAGNVAVYARGSDVLLVDSSHDVMADRLARALNQVTDQPPRYVVNTHWHLDHAGGNAPLTARGATIIAHPNTARRLAQDLTRREEPLEGRLPTKLVDQPHTLQLSGQEVRILHMPSAHTDGDLVVVFVDADVIHMGDLFIRGYFPYISQGSGGTIDGYIAAQEKVLALSTEKTRLIPGHGELSRREDLMVTLTMLKTARERVSALKKKGLTLDQVQKADPLADMQSTWGKGWIKSADAAKLIYQTL